VEVVPQSEMYFCGDTMFAVIDIGETSYVFVSTSLQSFELRIINSNGGKTFRKIVRKIRNHQISNFNDLIGDCGKSVQMQSVRRERFERAIEESKRFEEERLKYCIL